MSRMDEDAETPVECDDHAPPIVALLRGLIDSDELGPFSLTSGLHTMGRGTNCDIHLDRAFISRSHLIIEILPSTGMKPLRANIKLLESRNPTLIMDRGQKVVLDKDKPLKEVTDWATSCEALSEILEQSFCTPITNNSPLIVTKPALCPHRLSFPSNSGLHRPNSR